MSDIAIYTAPSGTVEVRLEKDSVWLTQRQLADLMETSHDNTGLHLRNIYAEGELESAATAEAFSVVRQEGKREPATDSRMETAQTEGGHTDPRPDRGADGTSQTGHNGGNNTRQVSVRIRIGAGFHLHAGA